MIDPTTHPIAPGITRTTAEARGAAGKPELLAALRELLTWCDAPGVAVKPGYVAQAARAAIAKAGGAP